jgi:hypothetical protein
MNDKLPEIIREARRALRRASGIPPTPDEQFEERRKAELETMERFVYDKFSIQAGFALGASVFWTEDGVAAKFFVHEKTFFLRKDKNEYRLTASETFGERELLRLSATDPQFCNRVLVAIGDLMDWQ